MATKQPTLDNHKLYGVEWTQLKQSHKWSSFWQAAWDQPLEDSFTKIPPGHSEQPTEDSSFPKADLLPGRPELRGFMGPDRSYLVRAEYIRVYNFIQNSYNGWDESCPFPAAVVTGQPGIGKSTWIDYAIRRRLGDGKVALLRDSGRYYLFGPDGVYETRQRPEFISSLVPSWCFIDAAQDLGLPPELTSSSARVFPIYVTSPVSHRWRYLHQSRTRLLIYMNYWCWDEMKYVMRFYPGCQLETVRARFDDLGPTPRHCLEFDDREVREYRAIREWKISQAPKEILQRLTQDLSEGLSLDNVSSEYCLIRRQFLTSPGMWRYVATVISSTVAAMIRNRLMERDQSRRC